jgi:hypothetical protein
MSRRVRVAVGGLTALTLVLATMLIGANASPAQAYTKWQSGVYTGGCGTDAVSSFSTWRHAKVERTSGYIQPLTWNALKELRNFGTCLTNVGVPITLSVGMLPSGFSTSKSVVKSHLITGAKGSYNKYWKAFGTTMVADGYSRATLRLGWEMNGNWFPWRADADPAHWITYWKQIVKTLRKVPGQHFTFEWSPALGNGGSITIASNKVYPGNSYVSYIGSTVYDQWWGKPSATVAARWKHLTDQELGLKWLAHYAKLHSKRVAIAEWGLASKTSFRGHGDGDNPYFISHFYAWMKTANMAYDIYFNKMHKSDGNEHRMAIGTSTNPIFTLAAATYRKSFGGGL